MDCRKNRATARATLSSFKSAEQTESTPAREPVALEPSLHRISGVWGEQPALNALNRHVPLRFQVRYDDAIDTKIRQKHFCVADIVGE